MNDLPALPLPAELLPEKVRRFGAPDAPAPAKMMAAKGLVPVQGGDLITLLLQLSATKDEAVSNAAHESLLKLPDPVLLPAAEAPLHPSMLHALARKFPKRSDVFERIILNEEVSPATVELIARRCDELTCELIATNQQRLLGYPPIVEALYMNKNARMSTVDRLVELCARNDVELTGIPTFKDHVEALQGQLIVEPTDEPLPSDVAFREVAEEATDEDAIDVDKVDQSEQLKSKFKPLSFRIRNMSQAEKIRLAIIGGAAERSILVRDPVRKVAKAAVSSPAMTEEEASKIASSKEVSVEVLRIIGQRKDWTKNHDVKRSLVFNPKTPIGISMKFLSHLKKHELKNLGRSRGVPNALKSAAKQRLAKTGG